MISLFIKDQWTPYVIPLTGFTENWSEQFVFQTGVKEEPSTQIISFYHRVEDPFFSKEFYRFAEWKQAKQNHNSQPVEGNDKSTFNARLDEPQTHHATTRRARTRCYLPINPISSYYPCKFRAHFLRLVSEDPAKSEDPTRLEVITKWEDPIKWEDPVKMDLKDEQFIEYILNIKRILSLAQRKWDLATSYCPIHIPQLPIPKTSAIWFS